jgi:hypothetical protein
MAPSRLVNLLKTDWWTAVSRLAETKSPWKNIFRVLIALRALQYVALAQSINSLSKRPGTARFFTIA